MNKFLTDKKFWEKRVATYDKLQWARREEYIRSFLDICAARNTDAVLDQGTGTGTIRFALSGSFQYFIIGFGALINQLF